MRLNILKYCIYYYFEKLHRYVYDNLFIPFEDKKYKPLSYSDKAVLKVYDILFRIVFKDFREYLKYWSAEMKSRYIRYNKYWRET